MLSKTKTRFKETDIGKIPEGWEVRSIDQLGQIITGKTPRTENRENFGQKYQFITPRDMKRQKHIFKTERYLSQRGKDTVKGCLIPKKSICVSCIGSDMGKVVMTTQESVTNQQINSVVPNICSDFVYYAILNISSNIKNLGKQSTAVPILNKSQFSIMKIALPSGIDEIEKIAKILSDIDEKIELNQLMNKTLEAIAQTIFKYWFIDFEFPNEKGKPYKSSGGEMTDSELGKIPKGWGVKPFYEVINVNPKRSLKKGSIAKKIGMADLQPWQTWIAFWGEESYKSGTKFKNGDILFARITPSLEHGKTALVSCLERDEVAFGTTEFIVFSPKIITSSYYILCLSRTEGIRDIAIGAMSGTSGRQRVPNDLFNHLDVVVPPDFLIEKFHRFVMTMFEFIKKNSDESRNQITARDSLLPKLMSGKIRVKEVMLDG